MAKPLYKSETVRNIILTYLVAMLPHIESIARAERITWVDVSAIFGALVFATIAIESRHDATEVVFTPKGLPGRNRGEAIAIESGTQKSRQ
ncbi:MAG TPA: hypothetical protein V6D27_00900 [Vampirovibrionales bacterium]